MKRSKKFWTWTDKNKRSSRSSLEKWRAHAPKGFRRLYHASNRVLNHRGILDELSGKDGVFSRRTERHIANWDWS